MTPDSDPGQAPPRPPPALCVDLDGTLVATDMLWESLVALLRARPLALALVPFWALGGMAHLKRRIAERVRIDPAALPYRPAVLDLVRRRRADGGRTVLATATDETLARSIAVHLGLFDEVVASDGVHNRKGASKLAAIRDLLGQSPFDYAGDSPADLPLWRAAARGYLAAPGRAVEARAASAGLRLEVLPASARRAPLLRTLRPQQWAKNVLVFVPLVMGHAYGDLGKLAGALLCFVAFSLSASAVYVLNDLMDLEADRLHPAKRKRPLAAGELSIPAALLAMVGIGAGGLAIGWLGLSWRVGLMLAVYLALTTAYSLLLKRKMMVDVLTLAGLYTLRILTGGVAVGVRVSAWLLAFSMFLFLSLAFAKRYTELSGLAPEAGGRARGRGYTAIDLELVRSVGPTSGYIAALLIVLYINLSPDVARHYPDPTVLYLIFPIVLYWITRIWFLAQRRQLADDPVVFALRDRHSLLAGALIVVLFVVASTWRIDWYG